MKKLEFPVGNGIARGENTVDMTEVLFKVPFYILSLLPTKSSFMLVCVLGHCYAEPRASNNVTAEI